MSSVSVTPQHSSFNPQSSTPLFVPGRRNPVAFLNGRTLKKGIEPRHFLNRPRAICFDRSIIDEAQRQGATEIRVICESTIYTSTMERFRRYCFPLNRLAGAQLGLELARWSIDGATPELDRREQAQALKDSQLGLWGVE